MASDPSWDIVMYDDIADAMKEATIETGAKICWGVLPTDMAYR